MTSQTTLFARLLRAATLIDETACELLTHTAQVDHVPAGRAIVREGETGADFYIILSGCVRVVVDDVGDEVGRLGRGSMFGEIAAIARQPRSATVIATEDCTLVRFDGEVLADAVSLCPALRESMLRVALMRTERNLARTTAPHARTSALC